MRSIHADLTSKQKEASLSPLYKIALTYTGGGSDATYEQDRVMKIDHLEEVYHQGATVLLNNSDKAITTNFQGFKGVISYGMTTDSGDKYSACAPLWVMGQDQYSSRGILTTELRLVGLPDLLRMDKASVRAALLSTDTQTAKDIITQAVKGTVPDWAATTFHVLDDLVKPVTQNTYL